MPLPSDPLQRQAREALPYFVKAWGSSHDETRLKDVSFPDPEGEPIWVQRLEKQIREEVDADVGVKRLHATIIQTLLDVAGATEDDRAGGSSPEAGKAGGALGKPRWVRSSPDPGSKIEDSSQTIRRIVRSVLKNTLNEHRDPTKKPGGTPRFSV